MSQSSPSHSPRHDTLLLFNAPVGYTKNPLIQPKQRSQRLSQKSVQPLSRCASGTASLEDLPFEIRVAISNQLSQIDCLSLLTTSSKLYASTVPRLYQHIIVDSSYTQFSKEYEFLHSSGACTFVNCSYNFKKLLTSYNSLTTSSAQIKILKVARLPDSINTYDWELNDKICSFFTKLYHLHELVWLGDSFRLHFVELLPNPQLVRVLRINTKFTSYLNELSPTNSGGNHNDNTTNLGGNHTHENTTNSGGNNTHDTTNSGGNHNNTHNSTYVQFTQLTQFQIRPFGNSRRLAKIINLLLPRSDKLEKLDISRSDEELNCSFPEASDLVKFGTAGGDFQTSKNEVLDLDTIGTITSKIGCLPHLTHLGLHDCLVQPSDAVKLANSIDMRQLTTLIMSHVSEFQSFHSVDDVTTSRITSMLRPSFTIGIAPYLINLRHLRIEFRQAYIDSVPQFLLDLPTRTLQSLDLTIRHNAFSEVDWISYAEAITAKNNPNTLTKLSIEVKSEQSFSDRLLPLLHYRAYQLLGKCHRLTSLRLNPDVKLLVWLLGEQQLSHLEYLDVFGAKSGGNPHLGLGTTHPSIYDEWFKVQHVAMLYGREHGGLRYIRVNKCVFEVARTDGVVANPRSGIDSWFDEKVRV